MNIFMQLKYSGGDVLCPLRLRQSVLPHGGAQAQVQVAVHSAALHARGLDHAVKWDSVVKYYKLSKIRLNGSHIITLTSGIDK